MEASVSVWFGFVFYESKFIVFYFIYNLYCEHHRNSKADLGDVLVYVLRSNKNKEKPFYAVAIQTLIQNNRWKRRELKWKPE